MIWYDGIRNVSPFSHSYIVRLVSILNFKQHENKQTEKKFWEVSIWKMFDVNQSKENTISYLSWIVSPSEQNKNTRKY